MGLFDNFNERLPEQEEKDLEMVKKYGLTLRDVVNQTPEICLAAVQQTKKAIVYIRDPEMKKQVEKILKQESQASTMSVF